MTHNQKRQIQRRAYSAAKIAYDCIAKAIDKINRIEMEADLDTDNKKMAQRTISELHKGAALIADMVTANKTQLTLDK